MNMKVIAVFLFFANTVLFATYYAVAKEALGRIDPVMFTFFETTTLTPIALGILTFTYHHVTWALVRRGMLLGSCLCLSLFTIAIALKYSTATGTAFFPALNGFLAALIAWFVLRQPINKATWCAGFLSVVGTVLLITQSDMGGARGAIIAFLGGLFFTLYVFLSDFEVKESEEQKAFTRIPLLAVELLTMALWASLIALLFGNWQAFHPSFPKDALVLLYVAFACTFLPTLLQVLMQKHVSAVTISFIYILEPVLGVVVAYFYLHEVLPLAGYLGGGLVVVGAFLHTVGSVERTEQPVQEAVPVHAYSSSQESSYNMSHTWQEETRATQEVFSRTPTSFALTPDTLPPTTDTTNSNAIWSGPLNAPMRKNPGKHTGYQDDEGSSAIQDITPQDFLFTLSPETLYMNSRSNHSLHHVELVEYVE